MISKIAHSLCLALVCSFVSAVSEQIADQNNEFKRIPGIDETIEELVPKANITKNPLMKSESNVYKYRVISDVSDLSHRPRYNINKYDGDFTENKGVLNRHINIQNDDVVKSKYSNSYILNFIKKNRVRRDEKANKCDSFSYEKGRKFLVHPHLGDNDNVNYSGSTYCTTVIAGPQGHVVQLTFIDIFHIEYHPECSYDFLEIRDGNRGYYDLLGKVCGDKFPEKITSTGPNVWLKFYSDETIEYEGFRIQIDFIAKDTSYSVPDSCVTELSGKYGKLSSKILNKHCEAECENQDLDYLWSIEVPSGYKIYLNFTIYTVAQPNECDKNFVQVYGSVLEYDEKKAHYCGSVANPVSTTSASEVTKSNEELDDGSIMHVRLFASKEQREKTLVNATFTAFRTLDLSKPNDTCDSESEFDCQDNTCIDIALRCDGYANCRLKADEEKDLCAHTTESLMQDEDIQMIVSIFCVILSGIILVFIFKCIMKLYKDHKIIKEQIARSREDRLEILGSQILIDAKRLDSDEEPRASLERDNQTNELVKQQKFQKERPISIDSDFQDSYQDIGEELWGQKVKNAHKKDDRNAERKRTKGKEEQEIDIKIEQNERRRIKEDQEYLRRKEELNKRKESEERKQISEFRDVSVGVPDTKQSECQTRDSLFQTEPIRPSLDGKPKSRGLSTFRDSGPSMSIMPPQIKPSEITFEVIMPIPEQQKVPQIKVSDRRPMSAETTRSAPDVIVLAKPTAL